MIPFFVADRPMSLNIVNKYLTQHEVIKVGLMSHAQTTDNFKTLFASFPRNFLKSYQTPNCEWRDNPISAKTRFDENQVIKIVDSGIFRNKKERGDYTTILKSYEEMQPDFGIMIDFLRDKEATIKSAKEAVDLHSEGDYNFNLITVAQGNNVEQYIDCYQKLIDLGSEYIAIGGLLHRRENTARYVNVKDETEMKTVITKIREEFNPEWLFVLGAYHPSRHDFFAEQNVWGSDYKGWIFNYTHKLDLVQSLHEELVRQEQTILNDPELQLLLNERTLVFHIMKMNQRKWNKEKEPKKKQMLWRKIQTVKSECIELDREIFTRRMFYICLDGLPDSYKQKVRESAQILNSTEREVRIAGVHKYLDDTILPKLINNASGSIN